MLKKNDDMRIYRLDILRASAILLVFTAHTVLSYENAPSLNWMQFGGTGVDLFFVLSGWLIGTQLFSELDKYGNIDIPRFWIRRWMRTIPAYYAVLIFTIIQLSITKNDFSFPWNYFFFIQNYDMPLSFFSVSWSLCVEEQFYLASAPLLLFLSRFNTHIRTIVLVIILFTPTVFRELDLYTSLKETHVRWDCCIAGILLAHIKSSLSHYWNLISKHALLIFLLSTALYCLFYMNRLFPHLGISDPSKLLLAIIFGSLIFWASKPSEGKLFMHTFIMYVSTRSYAIYLLHPDGLAVTKRLMPDQPFIIYYAFAFILSCAASEILYRTIEKPFMKARTKFRWSCSRKALSSFDLKTKTG